MKELTKKQRHEIYKNALEKLTQSDWLMCFALDNAARKLRLCKKDECLDTFESLPEFELFEPEEGAVFWSAYMDGIEGREKMFEVKQLILMFCIEMTK